MGKEMSAPFAGSSCSRQVSESVMRNRFIHSWRFA